MDIVTYTITDEMNKISKNLGTGTTYSCSFRGVASIDTPVIKINSSENLSNVNYAYIERYGRYYFVDRKETAPNNMWILYCKRDPLTSFANSVLNVTGTVTRSESLYNGYLNDSEYKSLAYRDVYTLAFPNEVNNDSLILLTIG